MNSPLAIFQTLPLKDASRQLLAMLGYQSDKFLVGAGSRPQDFLDHFATGHPFDQTKALVPEWKSADLLFQLTDQELSLESSLFTDESVQRGLLKSYIFIAIELKGNDYARGKFSAITRQINRLFPMPVMVIFKHGDRLTIAVINRRRNKIDDSKDVLEKATLIRDINFAQPHRGHLDILASLALTNLVHPQKLPITDFDTLHAAWEQIFNVELLNERFYRELANWYFWALPQVEFPSDLEPDDEKRRATGLIRLLTRLIFCWFLKEKGLIPEKLFHPTDLAKILKGFDPESETSSAYYQAILQNLFFATLNQRMGNDSKSQPHRVFATDEGFAKNRATYDVNNLYRYEKLFAGSQEQALAHFADIPFLNGGLFECLDRTEDGTDKKRYLDGFSRNSKKRPHVPDRLFFDSGETADLSTAYGDTKRKAEKVTGLITILNRYKFTIVENTPIDQEIALDPELLGKVFENLLASYNEETKTTARKQTGSFYTPRPIVDYMVDESLKAHLTRALVEKARMKEPDARAGLDLLFAYTEKEHAFTPAEVATLIAAIDALKILDPACGSGAFPMGVLHKLVYILGKLDPDNDRWKQTQLAKLDSAPMREELERAFADNNDDYGRKLSLIENCLYGVDIQPIAIQITKLRFFISLVCDQKTNQNKAKNHNVKPLPNLETKFVAADTLIGIPKKVIKEGHFDLTTDSIRHLQSQLQDVRHEYFNVQFRRQKLDLQKRDKELRQKLALELASYYAEKEDADTVEKLALWDPFDPQSVAQYFDPEWMFGRSLKDGFDIVIGNPPYIQIQKFPAAQKAKWEAQKFATYAATADIYCLFYERGANFLRSNGHLCYITSNKWMRAGYGEKIRNFFIKQTRPRQVIDFGGVVVFNSATVDSVIVLTSKNNAPELCSSVVLGLDYRFTESIEEYIKVRKVSFLLPLDGSSSWVVQTPERHAIKTQVEAQGVPLENWKIQINYGIKTGFNDAFYLTMEQRDAFIAADPSCAQFLVPLLRGRYVGRYASNWDGTWMINSHNGIKENGTPPINLKAQCPLLWQHVSAYIKELSKRQDKGEHWSNLRNCAYVEDFTKPKIMYPNMTKYLPFFFDDRNGFFTNDKGFIISSQTESLQYLTAFLNSHLFRCCFIDNFPNLGEDRREVRKIFVDKIPVKKPTTAEVNLFERLVPLIQFAKANAGASAGTAAFLEDLIDACVMECYFREHMAERDLLFHDTVAPHLAAYAPEANAAQQRAYLTHLHQTLNAPSHPIRNRLLRLTSDSPDLLAVIKREGRV
jgi:type I restriction-modification system DNA methylase subunit